MEQETHPQKEGKIKKAINSSKRKLPLKYRVLLVILGALMLAVSSVVVSFIIHAQTLIFVDYAKERYAHFYGVVMEKLPKPESLKSATSRRSYTLEEAILRVAREQRVPAVALAAMVEQESSNGEFLTSKVEMPTYNRLLKSMPQIDDDLRINLARSHGPAHVMGITALQVCDMNYKDLYDNYKGLTCAAKYLRIQMDRAKGKNVQEKLWQAFKGYNGTGPRAELHANKVYALMQKKMVVGLVKELS